MRLLEIEIYKLWHSGISKLLIFGYFLLIFSVAILSTIKIDIGPIEFYMAEQGIFNFPYIWHFNTFVASIFKFFLLLVIVSMMANEYTNRTLKQNLIDGLSKKEFILSKFYTVLVLSLVSTLFVFIVSLILGLVYSDFNSLNIILSDLEYLIAFFVKLLAFFSFGLFLGILIKRSAFAVGAMLIWYFGEKIAYGLMRFKFFDSKVMADKVSQFFPLESMSNLIKEPASRLNAVKSVANQLGEKFQFDYAVHWYEIAIALAWTAIFIYLSYYLVKKRDL